MERERQPLEVEAVELLASGRMAVRVRPAADLDLQHIYRAGNSISWNPDEQRLEDTFERELDALSSVTRIIEAVSGEGGMTLVPGESVEWRGIGDSLRARLERILGWGAPESQSHEPPPHQRAMLNSPTPRQFARAALIGLLAGLAFIAVGVLTEGWQPDPNGRSPYTQALGALHGWPAMLTAAVVLLLGLVRLPLLGMLASIPALITPYIVALGYELMQPGDNHNLFPIEVAFMLLGSALLHVPAFALRLVFAGRARAAGR